MGKKWKDSGEEMEREERCGEGERGGARCASVNRGTRRAFGVSSLRGGEGVQSGRYGGARAHTNYLKGRGHRCARRGAGTYLELLHERLAVLVAVHSHDVLRVLVDPESVLARALLVPHAVRKLALWRVTGACAAADAVACYHLRARDWTFPPAHHAGGLRRRRPLLEPQVRRLAVGGRRGARNRRRELIRLFFGRGLGRGLLWFADLLV